MNAYNKMARFLIEIFRPSEYERGYRKGVEDTAKAFERGMVAPMVKQAVRELGKGVTAIENPKLTMPKVCPIQRTIDFRIHIWSDK